jgi:hypothetical protein
MAPNSRVPSALGPRAHAADAKIPCRNFSQLATDAQKIDSLPSKHTFFWTKKWAGVSGVFAIGDK